jgi:hypothetical protein
VLALALLCLLAIPAAGWAEETGYKLVPGKVPDIDQGTAAIIKGEAGPDGDRFYLEHLTMLQPVSVVLMARDIARPLKLNLSKYRYDQSDRAGATGEEGAVAFHFRTQGELKIEVRAEDGSAASPAPYYLVAWVGDEFKPELPPPVVLARAGGGGVFPWKWLAIGLAVLIALGGVFWLGRRAST